MYSAQYSLFLALRQTDIGIIFEGPHVGHSQLLAKSLPATWELGLPSKQQGIFSILAEKIHPNGCLVLPPKQTATN